MLVPRCPGTGLPTENKALSIEIPDSGGADDHPFGGEQGPLQGLAAAIAPQPPAAGQPPAAAPGRRRLRDSVPTWKMYRSACTAPGVPAASAKTPEVATRPGGIRR